MTDPIGKLLDFLDEQEQTRNELLDTAHEAIRGSLSAMSALHRGDKDKVSKELESVEENILELNEVLERYPEFKDHGTVVAAHREYSEVILTRDLMDGKELPDPEDLEVLFKGYAQALAETIGELRRHVLDLLRKDKVDQAVEVHERMEKTFSIVEQFDYPDSILHGMRNRRDGARRSLEETRADITRAVREKSLEEAFEAAGEKQE